MPSPHADSRAPRGRVPRRARLALPIALLIAVLLAAPILLLRQPWQYRTKVLSARVPDSTTVVELWERPHWLFGFGYEHETWFVVRTASEGARWYVIDEQYLEFREVVLLLSPDHTRVRVETEGEPGEFHMVAECDLHQGRFRTGNEPTVRSAKGWITFRTAHVR